MLTWDQAQQYLRIAIYAAAGALANRGYISGEVADWLAGSAMGGLALLWTRYWNRQRTA